jgi:hypothetical protein
MKLPPETSSSRTHVTFGAFTWASLSAWSEFTELPQEDRDFLADQAKQLRGGIDVLLKEARDTEDQVLFGRSLAQARQNAWLSLVHTIASEAIDTIARRLANKVKDSPVVREVFPNLLATITKAGVKERPKAAELAAGRLANLTGKFNEKADLAARLQAAAQGAKSAVDANQAAFDAKDTERSDEVVAKKRLRAQLDRIYKALGIQFQGRDDFVESLFLKGDKPSEGESEAQQAKPANGAPATPTPPAATPANAAPPAAPPPAAPPPAAPPPPAPAPSAASPAPPGAPAAAAAPAVPDDKSG